MATAKKSKAQSKSESPVLEFARTANSHFEDASPCDDEAHVVLAGLAFEPLDGGSTPLIEEQAYYNVESSSGWTMLSYAILTAALTYGAVGLEAMAEAGGTSAGAAAAEVGGLSAGSASLSAGVPCY